jgi:hypothetical protein
MTGVYPPRVEVRRTARISADSVYRYTLVRRWDFGMSGSRPPAQFIMLNPSTADADMDDPTIRRCVGFARALDAGGIVVVNLYAFRATKPADLWRAEDPVGPDADLYLSVVARRAVLEDAPLIAAWGANAKPGRVAEALAVIDRMGATERLTALGLTAAGAPRHPLYLPATARPVPYGVTL